MIGSKRYIPTLEDLKPKPRTKPKSLAGATAALRARWAAEREEQERVQAEAAAKQQQEEIQRAETQRRVNQMNQQLGELAMDNSMYEEIVKKYAEAARAEIEREQAKSETQRGLEAAQRREEQLASEYSVLSKNVTHNAPRIKEIEAELKKVGEEISKHNSAIKFQEAQEQQHEPSPSKSWTPVPMATMPNRQNG